VSEVIKWSATETARRIGDGEVSCTEVTEAHLQQIEKLNPHLNAIVQQADDCLDIALTLDNTKRNGSMPLRGVPVTVKSNIDQIGFTTPNGVSAFNQQISTLDSPLVSNLKTSGAIILGRTNTPEFSMRWCTSNVLHGTTLNPWNSALTPGGSSGGAAAAVTVGMGSIAHGNDLGGSLRYPAFCCGVATIRPSMGRVPAFNPAAPVERPPITQTMSVQGPIARNLADVKLGLTTLSLRSSLDPLWHSASTSQRIRGDKVKIAYCYNPFASTLDPEIENAMRSAVAGLQASGAELIECAPPDAEGAAMLWGRLLFTEATVLQKEAIAQHGSAEMNQLVDAYGDFFGNLTLSEFIAGMAERIQRQRSWSQWFDQYDLLLMPTSLMRPFTNDLDFIQPSAIPDILEAQKPLFVVNLLGLPAVALPTHLADNVPVGVQLIAPMHDDAFVLEIAARLEQEIGTLPHPDLAGKP